MIQIQINFNNLFFSKFNIILTINTAKEKFREILLFFILFFIKVFFKNF